MTEKALMVPFSDQVTCYHCLSIETSVYYYLLPLQSRVNLVLWQFSLRIYQQYYPISHSTFLLYSSYFKNRRQNYEPVSVNVDDETVHLDSAKEGGSSDILKLPIIRLIAHS